MSMDYCAILKVIIITIKNYYIQKSQKSGVTQ